MALRDIKKNIKKKTDEAKKVVDQRNPTSSRGVRNVKRDADHVAQTLNQVKGNRQPSKATGTKQQKVTYYSNKAKTAAKNTGSTVRKATREATKSSGIKSLKKSTDKAIGKVAPKMSAGLDKKIENTKQRNELLRVTRRTQALKDYDRYMDEKYGVKTPWPSYMSRKTPTADEAKRLKENTDAWKSFDQWQKIAARNGDQKTVQLYEKYKKDLMADNDYINAKYADVTKRDYSFKNKTPLDVLKAEGWTNLWTGKTFPEIAKELRDTLPEAERNKAAGNNAVTRIKYKTRNAGARQQALSEYDKGQNDEVRFQLGLAKQDYDRAQRKGDQAGMTAAHQRAEDIRMRYGGYSGGMTGDEYISPDVPDEVKKQLNDKGIVEWKKAQVQRNRAVTEDEIARADSRKQQILDDLNLRKYNRVKEALKYDALSIGSSAVGLAETTNATMNEDFEKDVQRRWGDVNLQTLSARRQNAIAELEDYDKNIQTLGYDPKDRNRVVLQNELLSIEAAIDRKLNPNKYRELASVSPDSLSQRMYKSAQAHRENAVRGLGTVGRYATEAGMMAGEVLPAMALAPLSGGTSLMAMGAQAAGARMNELNARGVRPSESFSRGGLAGISAAATEKIPLERLGKLLKGQTGRNIVLSVLGNIGVEIGTEEADEIANTMMDFAYRDPEAEWSWDNIRDTAILTAISAGFMNVPAATVGQIANGTAVRPRPSVRGEPRRVVSNPTDVDNTTQLQTPEIQAKTEEQANHITQAQDVQTDQRMEETRAVQTNAELYNAAVKAGFLTPEEKTVAKQALEDQYAQLAGQEPARPAVEQPTITEEAPAEPAPARQERTQAQTQTAPSIEALMQAARENNTSNQAAERARAQQEAVRARLQEMQRTQAPAPIVEIRATPQPAEDVVAGMGKTLGTQGRALIETAAPQDPSDRVQYAGDFVRVYEGTFNGQTNVPAGSLNPAQYQAAVRAGQADRAESMETGVARSRKQVVAGRPVFVYDSYAQGRVSKEDAKVIAGMAQIGGLSVRFGDQEEIGNAQARGVILGNEVILSKTKLRGGSDVVTFVAGHETAHRLQDIAPKEYRALRDYVMGMDEYANQVDRIMERYARANANLSRESAMDEVVADFAGQLIADHEQVRKFIQQYSGNRNVLQKILDVLREFASKLTGKYKAEVDQGVKLLEDALKAGSEATKQLNKASRTETKVLQNVGIQIDTKTESAAPQFSFGSWNESDYVQDRDNAAKVLAKRLKITQKQAKHFIDSVNSVAKIIADDRTRLDYISSPGRSPFVSNVEYGGSIDFSTICKKRRLFTGTIDAIQRAMPDRVLMADEMLKIRAEMKKRGYEVGCGLCYVEGSRVKIGKYTKEFLDGLKAEGAEYVPTLAEMNTVEGQEDIRLNHPETYEKYVKFMNKLAQRKPKLFQMATEYKREILDAFEGKEESVKEKNKNGGLRLQSFSDFEIIHLIDCMQVIMDMSRVGLAGQAYTKQPEFAWALGNTGLKINLSLIAKGVDENGGLIFDDVEGMPIKDAMELRDHYSQNVGTVIVVFNDQQLLAALADDRIDFVLPFHRSQWNKKQYDTLGLPQGTKDYTLQQNEKYIMPVRHKNRNGKWVKERPANYMPNEYWNFRKSGKWNAEQYLKMCAENNRRPKFFKLLVNNGDGSYSLQPDGSTDGYWKLLIDFKMYDNEGNGSAQKPVRPEFNMDEAQKMLKDYAGGHENFPVAQDIVDEFVGGARFSISGPGQTESSEFKQWFGDWQNDPSHASKVVNADGSPKVVYHQTEKEFWTFDNSNPVAGKTDSETPSGFFFKDNDHDIGIGGARQVAAYLDMKKPLHFRNREAANAWYSKNIDGYKDLQDEMKAATKPLLDQMDQLERDMFSEETDEEKYEALDQKWNGILADLTEVENDYRGRLHGMLNRYFLDNDSGYDGIILDYDGHRYVDGKRENVKSYIVFDRTQIKSATDNIGTFDRGNPDTRFSISDEDGYHVFGSTASYTDERINTVLKEYGGGGNYAQGFVTYIDPNDFLKLTLSDRTRAKWEGGLDRGEFPEEFFPLDEEKLRNNRQSTYLRIDTATGEVEGHEGRHRMLALAREGITKAPVVLVDTATKYSKEPTEQMRLTSQDFGDGPVNDGYSVTVENLIPTNKQYRDQIKEAYGSEDARVRFSISEQTSPEAEELSDVNVRYSIRTDPPPMKTGIAYKVFFAKDGQLYPPMVANPGGAGTPVGVWLNADVGQQAPPSKTGRAQVKAGGKGTQGRSGSLAFRPGWHLGDVPHATQFARNNPETGKKDLFPANFVWAECEYAADVDYQDEAMSYGYTENGKFRHSYAGLPRLPQDGYYRYRTNPKPDTVPWIITGAMKVNRILTDEETDAICRENGVEPMARVGGPLTAESLARDFGIQAGDTEASDAHYSIGTEGLDEARLMRENQQLREKLEYWKSQTKRSDRTKVNPKDVRKLARRLARDYSTNMDTTEIADALQTIYDGIGKDWAYDQAYDVAKKLAMDMVEQASEPDDYLYNEYDPMRRFFRENPLILSASDRSQITDYNDWRKARMGKLRIQHGTTSNIDQVYQEASALWPEWFDEEREVTSLDQLDRIVEVMDSIYNREEQNPFGDDMEGPASYLAAEIMNDFWDMSNVKKTFADRAEARLGREVSRRLNMQEKYEQKLQEVRENREKKLRQQKEKYLGREKARSQRQKERELRAKILRHCKKLSTKLKSPTDTKHIPEDLVETVRVALMSINLSSKDGKETKRTQAFEALRRLYADMEREGSPVVIDQELAPNIADIIGFADTPIENLGMRDLDIIWRTVKAIENTITTYNKALGKAKFETISEPAFGIRDALGWRKDRGDYRGAFRQMDKLLNFQMLTPEAFFRRLGASGKTIFRMLRDAQDRHILIMNNAKKRTGEIIGKTNVKKLEKEKHTFRFDGETVQFTTAQIMSLYELVKRQQAVDHIMIGGIRPESIRKGIKDMPPSSPWHLTQDQVSEVLAALSEEEVKLADKLQHYLGDVMAKLGNEASLAVYGYRKFNEQNYFPISVDKNQVQSDVKNDAVSGTIAGWGSARPVTPNANNAVIVRSIFDVYADHVTEMANYAAWLAPMENLNRIFNFRYKDENGTVKGGVKDQLEKAFGQNGKAYWKQMQNDLNNGVHGRDDSPFSAFMGTYKASAIGANIRVIAQQPTAILRALDSINPADYIAGLTRARIGKFDRVVKKYAPIAIWKDWGYFQTDTGRQMRNVLYDDDSPVQKLNQVLMAGAGKADSISWTAIWNALEIETKRKRKDLVPRSDEFYRAVAERFNEVVDHTQVVDGILQRSQIMRSADGLTKMATSFMAEPTKTYNMVLSDIYDVRNSSGSERTAAMRRLARTVFALTVSITANAAAQSLVDALRDDDKDEGYWEKFFQAYFGLEGETRGEKIKAGILNGNIESSFNPLTYIPYLKDIISQTQGYSVSRMDMDTISRVLKAYTNVTKAMSGEGKNTVQSAWLNLVAETSRFLGIPVANIKRDVQSISRTYLAETGNYKMLYEYEKFLYDVTSTNTLTEFSKLILGAERAGDDEAAQAIRQDMIDSGVNEEKLDKKLDELRKKAVTDTEEFQTELANLSETYATMLESNDIFNGMEIEQQDKVRTTMANYAQFKVLGDRIEVDNDKMERIAEIEQQEMRPTDWVIFKTQFDDLHTIKDENGKDVETKQEQAIKLIDETFETEDEKRAAYRSVYDSDKNNPWA